MGGIPLQRLDHNFHLLEIALPPFFNISSITAARLSVKGKGDEGIEGDAERDIRK
jgi:hypothetical protein